MKVRIGLETHVQLLTGSKAFCGCRNSAGLKKEPEPNTLTCPLCLGLPGSMPRVNEKLLGAGVKVGMALNCGIAEEAVFSRKSYFYPDQSRNYQITQHEAPLGGNGFLEVDGKRIRIRRVHMEEDPGRLVHVGGLRGEGVLVDYNRSGTPLLEIVTEPDFSSPKEARLYLQKLVLILEYLGVYRADSRAIVKSDANISLQTGPKGGSRVEVKNITGTKEIEGALGYEIVRQSSLLKSGGSVKKETRAWNPELKTTESLRGKEEEEEYGYITEPDLTVVEVRGDALKKIKKSLPELPDQRFRRFLKEYGLSGKVAEAILSDKGLADFFEDVAGKANPRLAGNWVAGYLKKTLNYNEIGLEESGVRPEWMVYLLGLLKGKTITDRNAELAVRKMVEKQEHPKRIVKKHRLLVKRFDIELVLRGILKKEKKAVEDYRSGESKALNFLVGLAIKETGGSADAREIRKALLRLITHR